MLIRRQSVSGVSLLLSRLSGLAVVLTLLLPAAGARALEGFCLGDPLPLRDHYPCEQ